MTTKEAIEHIIFKIADAKISGDDCAESVDVDALNIALRFMTEARNEGKWMRRGASLFCCSECARYSPMPERYCPSCGAEMEVQNGKRM